MRGLKYLSAYSIPLSAVIGIWNTDIWLWLTPLFTFGLIPVLETILPQNSYNLSNVQKKQKGIQKRYDIMLYANIFWIYGVLALGLHRLVVIDLSITENIGLVLSVGIVLGSNGINVAHELGHRDNTLEKTLAALLLLPNFYMHFTLEHNYGHHQKVATPDDPATAKLNQTVYAFWWQSVIGQIKNAIHLQREFLAREGQLFWSVHNRQLWFFSLEVIYASTILVLLGGKAMVFVVLVGMVGFLLLETINYIEHYGLMREKRKSGRYYPVKNIHSWNANHQLGRIVLFELTRHSDHHYRAAKKYQILENHDESPQLPYGYPLSMLIALIPPLWFKLMNPRIPKPMNRLAA
ncbi:MAG: alkane 1-monooxygenase [Psychroflexus sp.]|nr:alkane 1-monooxygenase [Psychroflexus sp.]MDR9448610.1 alkane 1-monooxygenase [Psychroflexus sp.]